MFCILMGKWLYGIFYLSNLTYTASGCTLKVLYIWSGYNITFKLYPNKLDLEVKFKITNIDIRSDKPEMMSNRKKKTHLIFKTGTKHKNFYYNS